MNWELIKSVSWSLVCAKADIDFETNIEKREHVDQLEKCLMELLK